GLGQRLGGRAKATLQVGGVSVLERLATALRGAGAHAVSVVVGPYREQLLPWVARSGAQAVLHSLPTPSLVDSQRLALADHLARWPGHDLLLVLADLPLLAVDDVAPLVQAWRQRHAHSHALVPVVNGVRGHPLLLSAHAVAQVLAMPQRDGVLPGVRDWLAAHPEAVAQVHTTRIAHVTDVDTPDDVAALRVHVHPTPVAWPWP
ncbi:MAG: NTP transferase domain-containing protein, partial [Burkholderiaceae bacterium]